MNSFADNRGRQAVSQRQSHSDNGSAFRYGIWLFILSLWTTLLASGGGGGGLAQAKNHPTTTWTSNNRKETLTGKGGKLSIPNVAWCNAASSNGVMDVSERMNHVSSTKVLPNAMWMRIRGGAEDEEEGVEEETVQEAEEDEGDDDVENEEEDEGEEEGFGSLDVSEVMEKALSVSTKVLTAVGKFTLKAIQTTSQAVQRAIQAGMSGDEVEEEVAGDEEEEVTIVVKIMRIAKRMIRAALTPPTSDEDGDEEGSNDDSDDTPVTKSKKQAKSSTKDDGEDSNGNDTGSERGSDLGSFLSKVYGVTDDRDDSGPPVLGGTLTEALEVARSQARLLVVFIPSAKPSNKKQQSSQSADQEALTSILSQPVSQAANKKARKSGTTSGSFVVWGAKFGSSEATMAIKRLKVKATIAVGSKKGSGKPPMLLVVYPNLVRS
jgi:hypothetical protein